MDRDPRLLYSIPNIKAYHIENGEESDLTPSGPQTMSLLMVGEVSPYADSSSRKGEQDFYLHLELPPELDLPLPASTQIFHQPPRSYLIPRWEYGGEGSFTRIEFPPLGRGVQQEDIDTFETILAQCTAFLEHAQAPKSEKGGYKSYNPADYEPGQAYATGTATGAHGQVVLVNEDNGSVVGELAEDGTIVEDSKIQPGEKGKYLTATYLPFKDITNTNQIQSK
jgi:spartin